MNARPSPIGTLLCLQALLLATSALSAQPRGDAEALKAAMDSSGFATSFCVVLGCGAPESGELMIEIARGRHVLVHGLAYDDASLAVARKQVEQSGLSGQVTVDKGDFRQLPHLSNLANFVVIENPDRLAKAGFVMAEAERVLEPGGLLIVKRNGEWTKTSKPWPTNYDDWKHPAYGPERNRVSKDTALEMPVGVKWQDGLPIGLLYSADRGIVLTGGRLFTLGTNERENVELTPMRKSPFVQYLTARDAFNGLPQWKQSCKTRDDEIAVGPLNHAAIVSDGKALYAYRDGKAAAVDLASGKTLREYPLPYPAMSLLVIGETLVATCWESHELDKRYDPKQYLWAPWAMKTPKGEVVAFNTSTGEKRWSLPFPSQTLMACEDRLYAVRWEGGNPPTEQTVVAVDVRTGKEKWSTPSTQISGLPDLYLNNCAPGFVVLHAIHRKAICVLNAETGKKLWEIKGPDNADPRTYYQTAFVKGLLVHQDKAYDPATGMVKGSFPGGFSMGLCSPTIVAGKFVTSKTSMGSIRELPDDWKDRPKYHPTGQRGACTLGFIPAYGTLYSAHNWCRCAPGQLQGFVAMGYGGPMPEKKDFDGDKPLERGPAFGRTKDAVYAEAEWPVFRHDSRRSMITPAKVPDALRPLWQTPVAKVGDNPLSDIWAARIAPPVSAPVVAGGKVYVSLVDAGQVAALDAASGKLLWKYTAAGRVDSPPTIDKGMCFFGCHDGWVYALDADTGELAWRTMLAPRERKMVAFGQVESVWPVMGSVLALDGRLYATAGRGTEQDGGIALAALDPATGKRLMAKHIAAGPKRQNDVLTVADGKIMLQSRIAVDPRTLDYTFPTAWDGSSDLEGFKDGSWTRLGHRRSGLIMRGRIGALLLTEDEKHYFVSEPRFLNRSYISAVEKAKSEGTARLTPDDYAWRLELPSTRQAEGMVLAGETLVVTGSVLGNPADTGLKGFLWLVSTREKARTSELAFDAPPACNGAAVAGGRIYVSLLNGNIVCLGQ